MRHVSGIKKKEGQAGLASTVSTMEKKINDDDVKKYFVIKVKAAC
jgi:hypothetical protein